ETTLEEIIDSCLADSTKERYESGLCQLIKWIHLTGGTDLPRDNGTIDLRIFQYTHFVQFIVWVYQNTPVKVWVPCCTSVVQQARRRCDACGVLNQAQNDIYKSAKVRHPLRYSYHVEPRYAPLDSN
ncbi:hypothetical protein DYB36_012454, partial [Aphanomyces astaci]